MLLINRMLTTGELLDLIDAVAAVRKFSGDVPENTKWPEFFRVTGNTFNNGAHQAVGKVKNTFNISQTTGSRALMLSTFPDTKWLVNSLRLSVDETLEVITGKPVVLLPIKGGTIQCSSTYFVVRFLVNVGPWVGQFHVPFDSELNAALALERLQTEPVLLRELRDGS